MSRKPTPSELRDALGKSHDDVAREADLTTRTILSIEAGASVSVKTLRKAAPCYGLTSAELLEAMDRRKAAAERRRKKAVAK